MQHVSQQLYHLSHQISCNCFSSKSINYSINYLQNSRMHWSASGGNGTSETKTLKKKKCKLSLFTRYRASSVQDRNQNRTTHQATSIETRRTTKWIRGLGSVKQHAIEKKGGKDKCLRTQVVLDGLWMLDLYKKRTVGWHVNSFIFINFRPKTDTEGHNSKYLLFSSLTLGKLFLPQTLLMIYFLTVSIDDLSSSFRLTAQKQPCSSLSFCHSH